MYRAFLLAALLPLLAALSAPSEPPIWQDCSAPEYIFTSKEVEALARLIYGEARSCCVEEQAAVVWCVLNRMDSEDPYFPDTVMGVITQPSQFFGYSEDYPVLPELVEVAEDVLRRWNAEAAGVEDAGRVLPREYLYFSGDRVRNYFTVGYGDTEVWDWGLWSPYRDDW